jgi:hypothetical protein
MVVRPRKVGNRSENEWEFDGEILVNRWRNDGADCDGRLTRYGTSYCKAEDIRGGYKVEGIIFPRWQEGRGGQRDFSAEAMGY